jgi:hypothetical protein
VKARFARHRIWWRRGMGGMLVRAWPRTSSERALRFLVLTFCHARSTPANPTLTPREGSPGTRDLSALRT